MPTELAILPLTHPITTSNPTLPSSLIKKLKNTKSVLEKASGFEFSFFQQVEDPSIVHIVGEWFSLENHVVFLKSPENLALLEDLKDDIAIKGESGKTMQMWHIDTSIKAALNASSGKNVLTAPTISLNRMFIAPGKSPEFSAKLRERQGLLGEFTKPYSVIDGSRIERDYVEGKEREEWAVLSGFESVDHHMGFAKTESFEKYREITEFVESFELRHMKKIEL